MARFKARVLAVLAAIPEGRVTTYGTIARHLHVTARQVAFILATLTAEESERLPGEKVGNIESAKSPWRWYVGRTKGLGGWAGRCMEIPWGFRLLLF